MNGPEGSSRAMDNGGNANEGKEAQRGGGGAARRPVLRWRCIGAIRGNARISTGFTVTRQ